MKKLMILAAALLMVGSAFAAPALNAGRLFVQPNASAFAAGSPATTNNDDSCDIAVTPAATLLLPYFEVDYKSPSNSAVNTLFAITNTSRQPQIAHVTVWTDWSYPVLDFNIFLTGYDVQSINLYDIISRGVIPATGMDISNQGRYSLSNGYLDDPTTAADEFENAGNPNFIQPPAAAAALFTCRQLPGPIPENLLAAVQSALTTGVYTGCSGLVGGTHTNAIGYVTVDVAATCTQALPSNINYWQTEVLFDNTLIGDWFRINPTSTTGNYAGGNPMVHIRAIPEGGPAGVVPVSGNQGATNFAYTFYDRYTPTGAREIDRRQPLPGLFAARYIDRTTATDNLNFGTKLLLWREGVIRATGATPACPADEDTFGAGTNLSQFWFNSRIAMTQIIRFDEQENPSLASGCQVSPCPAASTFRSPETSARNVSSSTLFPPDFAGTDDAGGWMYLNLNNPGATAPAQTDRGAVASTQNWAVIDMTAEGRYGVDYDAAYLANGCTPNPGQTNAPGPRVNATATDTANVTTQVDVLP